MAEQGQNVKTLYHYTEMETLGFISYGGMRSGDEGMFGAGIYFAETPELAQKKAACSHRKQGAVLKCEVALGRVKYVARKSPHLTYHSILAEGCDSICALDRAEGGAVGGREYIVFRDAQVLSQDKCPPPSDSRHKNDLDFQMKCILEGAKRSYEAEVLGSHSAVARISYGDPPNWTCDRCGGNILVPMSDAEKYADCMQCSNQIERPIRGMPDSRSGYYYQ